MKDNLLRTLKNKHRMSLVGRAVFCSFFVFHFSLSAAQPTASDGIRPSALGGTNVVFSTVAEGEKYPIVWGMDAAWISQDNVRRGIAFIGKENI